MQPFDIDLTELTHGAYAICVDAGVCAPPKTAQASDWTNMRKARPTAPVTYLDPEAAAVYCGFVHARLPTEEEWEYAARGTDFRKYPWGNEEAQIADLCPVSSVVRGVYQPSPCAVGTHPKDRSPFGVLDMASNVREIVTAGEGRFALRGSGAMSGDGPATDPRLRTAFRGKWDAIFWHDGSIGFR